MLLPTKQKNASMDMFVESLYRSTYSDALIYIYVDFLRLPLLLTVHLNEYVNLIQYTLCLEN
jgi:hypothetical protein